MKACERCGAQNNDNAFFCDKCGTKLASNVEKEEPKTNIPVEELQNNMEGQIESPIESRIGRQIERQAESQIASQVQERYVLTLDFIKQYCIVKVRIILDDQDTGQKIKPGEKRTLVISPGVHRVTFESFTKITVVSILANADPTIYLKMNRLNGKIEASSEAPEFKVIRCK